MAIEPTRQDEEAGMVKRMVISRGIGALIDGKRKKKVRGGGYRTEEGSLSQERDREREKERERKRERERETDGETEIERDGDR
jgi:hypothetical protein